MHYSNDPIPQPRDFTDMAHPHSIITAQDGHVPILGTDNYPAEAGPRSRNLRYPTNMDMDMDMDYPMDDDSEMMGSSHSDESDYS